jgi:HAD superfamily hydrolase (TIGR01549 family)
VRPVGTIARFFTYLPVMKPKPLKAILLDLDDTLWPILPVIQRAEAVLFDWLKEHAPLLPQRYTVSELRQKRLALMATHRRYQFDLVALRRAALVEAFAEVGENQDVIDTAMTIFNTERNRVDIFEDVVPALTRLGRQYRLGVVTNGPADLEAIGIAGHFRVALAAHAFGTAKPDPGIFLAGCEALDVTPDEALYVGDDPMLDVAGAQSAGLRAVWMNRVDRVMPPEVVPDAVCASFDELEAWLAQQSGPPV